MALSDLSGVLSKLGDLTLQKALELYGVRDQVEVMRVELNLIQGILQDADSIPNKSQALINWMNELRVVANGIDTVMDTFLQKIEKEKTKGCCTVSKLKFWKKPLQLNELSGEIGRITPILKILFERGTQLGITASATATATGTQMGTATGTGTENTTSLPFRPTKPSDIDDSQVVGLDSDKDEIIRQLLDKRISRRTILSIVGVGGLGKTTLAQKVYKSTQLEGRFECRAWVSISEKFKESNILREILYSIKPTMKDRTPPVEDKDLAMEVESSLNKKRYLIMLDDVWKEDVWDRLQKALPDANNSSRVIITTRNGDVAATADRNTKPYLLHFLTDDESVALLFRKAFQQFIPPENYPPSLKDVAQRLIKKCGGLPLALVVLGGILSTNEDTFTAWNRVCETMNWHDKDGEKCTKVLAMSYEHLPYHLRKCFLYFASFPEDYNISAEHMTRMWVAEEFIPKHGAGSLEDQAEKCLQELVKRCLVQVTEEAWNGYCKYCRMHDLVRELAMNKAKEDNFLTVLSKEGDGGNQQLPPNRVSLQFFIPTKYEMHSTNTRSLLCFGNCVSNYQGFKELRVLVFEHVRMSNKDISCFKNWLEGLLHLKYLGFRYCMNMSKGFETISFSGLKSLETLDCTGTETHDNPSLWEIPTLRHVITDYEYSWPSNWNQHKNLQTLKWIGLNGIPTLECECNVNLRTLKINCMDGVISIEEAWQRLQTFLSRTMHLVSLTMRTPGHYVPFLGVGTSGLPCHEKIQSLDLGGRWARDLCAPSVEMFPRYLTKLKLSGSCLDEDPMPILERLQSLRILHLLDFSYMGRKMICSTGGFPSLHKLKLHVMPELREWEIEEGAMHVLHHLNMYRCLCIDTLPQLQNMPSLQELVVTGGSEQLHERLQTEDRYKIQHIPSVCITT